MWSNLADSLHFAGHEEESAAAFRRVREICVQRLSVNSSDSESFFLLAWSQHRLGDSQDALATVAQGLKIEPSDPYGYYFDALIRYQSGDQDAALKSLQIALDKGYPVAMLVAEPYLGELRANEKFHAMIIASSF
jgi:serine/threonine-protein kinase